MAEQILTKDGLIVYDEEIKEFILDKSLTKEEVQNLIDTSCVQVSEDNTFEDLEDE